MKFLQDLILAILLPRKSRVPVKFKLTKAQQRKVLKDCYELNSLIQEVHGNLSDIRHAGKTTTQLTKQSHKTSLKGRQSLIAQQKECERINQELKKISEDMRAVRENVAITSQKTIYSYNGLKNLQCNVLSTPVVESSQEATEKSAEIIPLERS